MYVGYIRQNTQHVVVVFVAQVNLAGDAIQYLVHGLIDGIEGNDTVDAGVYIHVDIGVTGQCEQQFLDRDLIHHHGIFFHVHGRFRLRQHRGVLHQFWYVFLGHAAPGVDVALGRRQGLGRHLFAGDQQQAAHEEKDQGCAHWYIHQTGFIFNNIAITIPSLYQQ